MLITAAPLPIQDLVGDRAASR